MAKAKQTQKAPEGENPIVAMLINNLKENFIGKAIEMAKERIKRMQTMAMELAVSLIFFLMAIVFMLGALMFLLKEYFLLSYTISFFFTGIVAIIIAFVFYKIAKKE